MLRRLVRHRPASLAAFTGAGVTVVVATFLPWLRSGRTTRSSYDLLGLLDRLGLAPDGAAALLVRWWPVVPLLVTLAVVLAWWRRWIAASAAAVVSVLYAGGVGATLMVATRDAPVSLGPGPWLCAAASSVFLCTAVWLGVTHATPTGPRAPIGAPPADRS